MGRAIREGTPPRVGADDLVGQARAVEAVHRAMAEGASVVPAPPSPPAG